MGNNAEQLVVPADCGPVRQVKFGRPQLQSFQRELVDWRLLATGLRVITMPNPAQPDDDIEFLDAIDGIRRRPQMYVGPLDDPRAIHTLLFEALCLAFDNAASGCATEIEIDFQEDGSASVRDNGPGLSVDIRQDGLTIAEFILTRAFACREAKRREISKDLCGAGIVVTNALSDSLTLETVQDGFLWRQTYLRGRSVRPIEKIAMSDQQWERITFHPDPLIFGDCRLSAEYFTHWFQQRSFELGQATVTLIHNGESVNLRSPSPESK